MKTRREGPHANTRAQKALMIFTNGRYSASGITQASLCRRRTQGRTFPVILVWKTAKECAKEWKRRGRAQGRTRFMPKAATGGRAPPDVQLPPLVVRQDVHDEPPVHVVHRLPQVAVLRTAPSSITLKLDSGMTPRTAHRARSPSSCRGRTVHGALAHHAEAGHHAAHGAPRTEPCRGRAVHCALSRHLCSLPAAAAR